MSRYEGEVISIELGSDGISKVGLKRPMAASPIPEGSSVTYIGGFVTSFVHFWPGQYVPEKGMLIEAETRNRFSWHRLRRLSWTLHWQRITEIKPTGKIEVINFEGQESVQAS
jgi:hypothetical protein